MRIISFSEARNNLKQVIDKVVDDADVAVIFLLITRGSGNPMAPPAPLASGAGCSAVAGRPA